jgi:hypothetical protein
MNAVRLAVVIAVAASCHGGDDRASVPAVAEASGGAASPSASGSAGAGSAAAVDGGLTLDAAPAGGASYRAALERGRRRVRAKDWRGGVAAFDEALAARPGDARALSELGWAAFRAGDLERAAQASHDASTAAGASVRVRAAALYNLGRVDEARGDKDGAAEAYRASLQLHGSRAVKRHLRAIVKAGAHAGSGSSAAPDTDGADVAAASGSDDAGAGMVGPFATIDAYCDAQVAASDDDASDDASGRLCAGGSGLAAGVDHASGPPEVKVVGVRGELDDVTCLLALHAHDGWYLWDGIPCATSTAAGTDWAAAIALDTPAPGRLVARFAIGVAVRDSARGHHACQEVAVACVVDGARPSCSAAAPIAWAKTCSDAPTGATPPSITWDSTASWSLDHDVLAITPPSPARAAPGGLADLAAAHLPLRP